MLQLSAWSYPYPATGRRTRRFGKVITVAPGGDIAAALAAAQPGDVVQLQEGVYDLYSTIFMKPGVTLRGAGPSTVLNKKADIDAIIVPHGTNGVHIENLKVEGNGIGKAGIFVMGDGTTISNVTSVNHGSHGIGLHEVSNCVVEGCTANDNGAIGIAMYASDNNVIRRCTTNHNGAEGITVDHNSDGNVVEYNTVHGNCTKGGVGGIGIDWARDNVIRGNTITGTLHGKAGIFFQNNEGESWNNTVVDNVIQHRGGPGICIAYQVEPSQDPVWNSTGNVGPSPTQNTIATNNTITTTNFGGVIIVDGIPPESFGRHGKHAMVVFSDGRVEQWGNGSSNQGNVLTGNRS